MLDFIDSYWSRFFKALTINMENRLKFFRRQQQKDHLPASAPMSGSDSGRSRGDIASASAGANNTGAAVEPRRRSKSPPADNTVDVDLAQDAAAGWPVRQPAAVSPTDSST